MKMVIKSSPFIFLTLMVAATTQEKQAIVVLNGPTVKGNITFVENGNRVIIRGKVIGLNKGLHGFHIHEKGDLSNGCVSTGSHFNPDKKNHGSQTDRERHVGDLGNIEANDQGEVIINITDERISLSRSKYNILGRAVVIHADVDDLGRGNETDSLTTGHAGARVACGIIGTLNTIIIYSNACTISSMKLPPAILLVTFLYYLRR